MLIAALMLLHASVQSQETKPDATAPSSNRIQILSRLVVLDVVVTGKKGELHNDLTKDDFVVTEDGVPQTISHFELPSTHRLPAGVKINSTAELEHLAPQAPVTVMVLDELNTRYQDMAYARYALKKYLNAQPGQLQAPTMLVAVNATHLQVLKDYTLDREAILAALDKHLAAYPWSIELGTSVLQQLALSLGALETVAKAAAGHPGHKNVLWVGHGFPGIDLTGANLDQNSITGITNAVQQGLNMLRDSRITLYTIDPTALSSSLVVRTDANHPDGELADANSTDPFLSDVQFTALATATGGKSFYSRNDVDQEIGESASDGVNYYTLSYRPTSVSDAAKTYRKIRVTLKDPSLSAGFRDGYYIRNEAMPDLNKARKAYDIDAAMENRLVYTGIRLTSVAKPDLVGEFVVGVLQPDITWADEGDEQTAHLKLVTGVFDPKGKLLSRKSEDLTEHRPMTDMFGRNGPAHLGVKVDLAPTASRVRFVVWDAVSGRIGTSELHLADAPPDAPAKRE
jgi:VWFA-related protein